MASNISKDAFFNVSSNPNLDAADTGVDPSTGRLLSKKERIAIFKNRKINASKVFGRKKNLVPNIVPNAQPQDSKIPSSSAIVKSDVSSDQTKDKTKSDDSGLAKTVENIQKSLSTLQDTVKKISDSLLEEKKKKQEQEDKSKRDAKIQTEKDNVEEEENLLEKTPDSLRNKLLAPMQSAGKAIGGILDKLKAAFELIFTGFLVDKGLKMVKAFMDGDYKAFAGFALSITATLGIAGGIMLALSGGLGALPALIAPIASMLATVGTAIIGFLLSPPGLITLAVIAGIGAAVMGANALRTAMAGGKEFRDAHKKNNERLKNLKDMGVSSGGKIEVDGKSVDVMEHGTEEQKAAYMEFKKERDRLDGIRDEMNKEINDTHDKWWKQVRETSPKSGVERKQHWADARVKWAETKANIRAKYEAKIGGADSSMSTEPTSEISDSKIEAEPKSETNISKVTPEKNLEPVSESEPEVVVQKSSSQSGSEKSSPPGSDNPQSEVPSIASSNPSNFYTLYSEMNYNITTT